MLRKRLFALIVLALLPLLFISRDAQADPQSSIKIAYATFDPIIEGEPAISRNLRGATSSNYRILQLMDTPNSATIAELRGLGIEFLDIIPTNAYVVRLDGTSRRVLEAHPAVRWLGALHPAYKISTDATDGEMKVMLFPDSDVDAVAKAAEAAGGIVTHKEDNEFGQQLVVEISAENLPGLAAIDQVRWIQNTVDYFFVNDSARSVVQSGNFGERLVLYNNGLTGEGHVTALADSGLDGGYDAVTNEPRNNDGSCYFAEADGENFAAYGVNHRKIIGYNGAITPGGSDGQDENGHGTHVAGSIAGDQPPYGVLSPNDGQAYAAKLYFHDINDDGSNSVFVPPDLRVMYADAYDVNKNGTFEVTVDARIHSNSWGSLLTTYEGNAFETDDYLWNNPEMLILFAGGNQGNGPATIGTPGVAKNLVTVGATENGSASNDLAQYSSHGPVVPNGRLKPDVSAPGSSMVSALYNDLCGTQSLSGTSMATPTTNGISLLMRQYLYEGYYPHGSVGSGATVHPSGMLLKSMLINSGRQMTGLFTDNQGGIGAWPSNGQGWGRIAADDVLFFPGDTRDLWFDDVYSNDGTIGLDEDDDTRTYTLDVKAGEPLKISLVWYDSATSPIVGLAGAGTLNNEMDLTVVGPDGTHFGNDTLSNDFSPNNELNAVLGETVNNTEMVYLTAPTAGEYTITVELTRLSSTDGRKQPFAIVATGAFLTSNGKANIVGDSFDPTPTSDALLQVFDADLNTTAGMDTVTVAVTSTTQTTPFNVELTETGNDTATFEGSIVLYTQNNDGDVSGDVEVVEGDIVRLTYDDANDELNNFHQAFDTAEIRSSLVVNLNPPDLNVPDNADGDGEYTLDWSSAETDNPWDGVTKEIASYYIEESTDYQSLFTDAAESTANWDTTGLPGFAWRSELYPGAISLPNVLRAGQVASSAFGADSTLTLSAPVSVPLLGEASLTFYSRYFSDPDDSGVVELSTNGTDWVEAYKVTRSPQVAPVDIRMEYTTIDLSDYRGEDVHVRFAYSTGDLIYFLYPAPEGWRVDDLSMQAGTWQIAQPAPQPGSGGPPGSITSDEEFTITEQTNGTYFHRVRAIYADGTASGWSNVIEVEVTDGAVETASLSIDDVTVGEGDGSAELTVTLSEATAEDVGVDFTTVEAGSATGDQDFVATSGTLTITAGLTTGTISVTISDDMVDENDEVFGVTLSSPTSNAEIADGTGVVTITDNDETTISLSEDATVSEDAGSVTLTVTLSAESTFPISATYSTQDGTATSGDYTATNGTVEFAAGETSKTIDVLILSDNVDENDETFTVELADPANAMIDDGSATITITDEDNAPTLSVADVTVDEGAEIATITVELTGGTELIPTVMYATSDGSALAGSDYTATSGTLTFDVSSSETFTVAITDDNDDENTELFNVTLSNPTDATIDDGSAEIRINDNDTGTYELRVGNMTVDESAGTASVTVTLSAPPISGPITVDYATSDGTATVDEDYTEATGTITFPTSDNTTQMITVAISPDELDEIDETLLVTLSNANGADSPTIADDQGVITITDNDAAPAVSVAAASASESAGTVTITVTLDAPSGKTITVDYATGGGTATDGSDYTGATGTLTFLPGQTTATFTIAITPDNIDEDDETFNVTLSNESNATLGMDSAVVTIEDSNATPTISIADTTVNEGVGEAAIEVTLSAASGREVTVNYATSNGSAIAGEDYTAATGTTTFAVGETTAVISVTISADTLDEANETFDITLSAPSNATLTNDTATITISDDDAPPSITIDDVTVDEADGTATFTISLDAASSLPVSVDYATSNNTATAGEDYTAENDTVMIPAGQTSATVDITIINDTLDEEDTERFFVMLSNPSNGSIGDNQGSATITDDDPTPALTIADSAVNEGVGMATVTVTLSAESSFDVTVDYETADGARAGAIAGEDYTAISGTVTIPAGQTTATVAIEITDDDTANEGDETFSINFSNPTHATLDAGNSSATVTISDNEIPTAVGLQAFDSAAATVWWLPLVALLAVSTVLVAWQYRRD